MFTGTLIEDLFAAVERVEMTTQPIEISAPDFLVAEALVADSWFASVQESTDCESKFFDVA